MRRQGGVEDVAYRWVPYVPERGWDETARLAVDATLAEVRVRGGRPSVVSVQRDALQDGPDPVRRMARDFESGTLRGRWPQGGGPVLAWVPNVEVVRRAVTLARGSALVVAEFPDRPVGLWTAWAAAVGAVDVTTGKVTPDRRSDQLKADLEYVLWNGNNNWPAKDYITGNTVQRLAEVHARGELDEAVFAAAALVEGKSRKAIDRLVELVQGVAAGPSGRRATRASRAW